jgi:hypothetical protein
MNTPYILRLRMGHSISHEQIVLYPPLTSNKNAAGCFEAEIERIVQEECAKRTVGGEAVDYGTLPDGSSRADPEPDWNSR